MRSEGERAEEGKEGAIHKRIANARNSLGMNILENKKKKKKKEERKDIIKLIT